MLNHLSREYKTYFKSFLGWGISVLGLVALFMSFYPSFEKQVDDFMVILKGFPPAMISAMGIDIEQFASFNGYISYVFNYVLLIIGIYSLALGLSLFSAERRQKVSDFLYVKPISRGQVLINKFVVGLSYLLGFNLLIGVSFIISNHLFDVTLNQATLDLWLSGCLLSLLFYSFGVMIASFNLKIKRPLGVASGIVIMFFMMLVLARLIDLEWLKNLTPFGLLESNQVLIDGIKNGVTILLMSAVMCLLGFIVTLRKDIL